MNKIDILNKTFRAGGLKGLVRLAKFYKDMHFRHELKNKWPVKSIANADMALFGIQYGYYYNLYNPHSFTEKVHTYKLLYNDPVMSEIVDKYDFKGYVKRKLGSDRYTAEALGVYDSMQQIEAAWSELPNEFVLKSTVSSDGNNIIFVNKDRTSLEQVRKDLEKCFDEKSTLLNAFSRAYYPLKPRLMAEEYLHEPNGGGLWDYKFYCFSGEVEFVYTTSRLFEQKENPSDADYARTFFNLNWEKIPVALGDHPTADGLKKPEHLEEMINISKALSKDFPFVRIDFYDLHTPLLGEMTFYPTGGWKPLNPPDFDRKLGDKFIIPPERLIKM